MTKKIRLHVDFHSKETYVRAHEISRGTYRVNDRQWYSAQRRLCEIKGCKFVVKAHGYFIRPVYGGVEFITKEQYWA